MLSFLFGFIFGVLITGVAAIAVLYFRRLPVDPPGAYSGPPTPARIFFLTL